ncbi:hypothetical protein FJZ53_07380, partial [Candidatus Woesearchaeota archaeon]|nr:hypothetical protein [Candidatus Woesearchaeota archaeon]
APSHQNAELQGRCFESFGMKFCFNRACMIDLSGSEGSEKFNGVKYLIEVDEEHLKPWEDAIRGKGAVIIRTGYDKWLEANKAHVPERIPYLTEGAADFISRFKGLKVFGTDSLTVDPIGGHYAHKKLKSLLIVESMVHLSLIPDSKRKDFFLQTSPVRIVGATGGPVVAYAFVKQ